MRAKLSLADKALIIAVMVFTAFFLVPILLGWASPDETLIRLDGFTQAIWRYIYTTLPYLIASFLLAGVVQEFIPRDWITKHLGSGSWRSIGLASILGVTMDVCAPCGALPIAMALYRVGASTAAVIAFLTSTPWLGVVEFSLLVAFVGLQMAIIISILSIVVAFSLGMTLSMMERRKMIEGHEEDVGTPKPWIGRYLDEQGRRRFDWSIIAIRLRNSLRNSWNLSKVIIKWVIVGFIGGGIITIYLDPSTIGHNPVQTYLGFSAYSLPLAYGISVGIECCSEYGIPIAGELYRLGASPGALFVFLMGGMVSDYTELGTIASFIGKRTAIATLIIGSAITFLVAYLMNLSWIIAK